MQDQKKNLENLSKEELIKLAEALEARKNLIKFNKIKYVFPKSGPFSRDKYPKQMEFFKAGKHFRIRALMGGNRSGKSFTGATEYVYHATLQYPDEWQGRVMKSKGNRTMWIVCESNALWTQSLQKTLLGGEGDAIGTGLIPLAKHNNGVGLVEWAALPGAGAGAIGKWIIKDAKGNLVTTYVKTYEMEREQFQAAKVSLILFDEEPPLHIWSESITRLMSTGIDEPGIAILCFTPLKSLSHVVLKFLPGGRFPDGGINPDNNYYTVRVSWEDIPHLSEEEKEQLRREYDPKELSARTQGIPGSGMGKVFPTDERFITVTPFAIPSNWKRAYGMDFGWDPTAAVWMTYDPSDKVYYVYSEYKQGRQALYVHANAIKSKGEWIPGLCDPSRGLVNYNDGTHQMEEYQRLGLALYPSDSGIQSGINKLLNGFESGTIKIFYTCVKLLEEIRLLHYDDENPNKIKDGQEDHETDALKYVYTLFHSVAKSEDDHYDDINKEKDNFIVSSYGRCKITGY